MQLNRRTMLQMGAVAGLTQSTVPLTGQPLAVRRQPPQYRIIYNWDGAPHGYSEYPQSLEQFVDKTFAPLRDTQVDALFWCLGEHEASWLSPTLPQVGDSQQRLYQSARAMRHNENIRAMLKRGENPHQALVERGRELGIAVYASIRMNDNHFGGLQLDRMPQEVRDGLTKLRKEHPQWCLGAEQAPRWFAASWNMAVPEVRQHRLQYITEALDLADWDGVELDWQRHGFHLPATDAYRLRYTLTDLQRAVRNRTQELASRRKRPFHVAVRVATTMESCRRIGYDLEEWVDQDLCDLVVAGGGAGTDPGVEVEQFQQLLAGHPIRFYPGFDSGFWGTHTGLQPPSDWQDAWVRGTAAGYWDRGVDGIYVFNWHANQRTRRHLLTRVGATETLVATNKVYATLHRHITDPTGAWGGADLHDRILGETPVALYPTLTGNGPVFAISVHDDVVTAHRAGQLDRCELRIGLAHHAPDDQITVTLDNNELPLPAVRYAAHEDPQNPSDIDETGWLVWALPPAELAKGKHQVQVSLSQRDARIRPPLTVEHIEVHLHYR
ncbi:MAG: hypothetical protein VX346_17660 [Planctomycetota bacterium]|nr:hypothetical protein [Planctomycetota bacterium]